MKRFQEMSYKERVKRYLIATLIIGIIMLLIPRDYPMWTVVMTFAILGSTLIFNFYKWRTKAETKGNHIVIFNNIMGIIVCYFIFIVPYTPTLRFSILYFVLTFIAFLFDYIKELRSNNSKPKNLKIKGY